MNPTDSTYMPCTIYVPRQLGLPGSSYAPPPFPFIRRPRHISRSQTSTQSRPDHTTSPSLPTRDDCTYEVAPSWPIMTHGSYRLCIYPVCHPALCYCCRSVIVHDRLGSLPWVSYCTVRMHLHRCHIATHPLHDACWVNLLLHPSRISMLLPTVLPLCKVSIARPKVHSLSNC